MMAYYDALKAQRATLPSSDTTAQKLAAIIRRRRSECRRASFEGRRQSDALRRLPDARGVRAEPAERRQRSRRGARCREGRQPTRR